MKFVWMLMAACLLVSSNAMSLRSMAKAKKPMEVKTIAHVRLKDGSTVKFFEREDEGVIFATMISLRGTKDDEEDENDDKADISGPIDLYRALTGEEAPEELKEAQERMKAKELPEPSSMDELLDEDLPLDETMDDEDLDDGDGHRALGSCNSQWWETNHCRYYDPINADGCRCLLCKTGTGWYHNKSEDIHTKAHPFHGSMFLELRVKKCILFFCEFEYVNSLEVLEGWTGSVWAYSSNQRTWRVTFDAGSSGFNGFYVGYTATGYGSSWSAQCPGE